MELTYEETFDDFVAVINGEKRSMRLSIFKYVEGYKGSFIVYQADAFGVRCFKKLKNQIGEFRYGFTTNTYDILDKTITK